MVKYLIKNKADLDVADGYPLIIACSIGNIEVVKLLVENGANIMVRDNRGYMEACKSGNLEIVRYLLLQGVDINTSYGSALHYARSIMNKDLQIYLIESGVKTDKAARHRFGKDEKIFEYIDNHKGKKDLTTILYIKDYLQSL